MKCQACDSEGAVRRRQGSAYVDDEKNFAVLCDNCQKESHEYWMDQFNEYYNLVGG